MEPNQQQNQPAEQFVKPTSLTMPNGTRMTFDLVSDGSGGWDVRKEQKPEYQKALKSLLISQGLLQ